MKTVTKTAVSVPSPVFEAAEELALQMGVSRSELVTRALAAFIEEHQPQRITESLNRVYAGEAAELDPAIKGLQFASVPREDGW